MPQPGRLISLVEENMLEVSSAEHKDNQCPSLLPPLLWCTYIGLGASEGVLSGRYILLSPSSL